MNRIKTVLFLSILLASNHVYSQKVTYTLEEIIQRAKLQSPSSKVAETRKENRYWSYRLYKADLNPQLVLSGAAPGYANAFINVPQEDGSIQFQSVNRIISSINLGFQQPLPWTGGRISVNSNLSYFDQLGDNISNELWRGSPFTINLRQPIFAFSPLKWDKKIEPLRFEESKRGYVEEMELISRQATSRFFNYLESQINLQIAQFNLASVDTVYRIENGRYNIGTTSKDKLLQTELQLLRSKQDVATARLGLETARLRLRSFISLNDGVEFDLLLPEQIPEFEINFGDALKYGQNNRSDYLGFKRRKLEAEREVASARGDGFQVNLDATYGLNDTGSVLDDVYSRPINEQRINIRFSVPVLSWGRNEARMKTALANQRLQEYIIAQDEQDFEQEILTQVRQFELLRLQLEISKKSDEVAEERYNVAQKRYLIGKIDITDLNIALNEKDQAKRRYIGALREFWVAYYNLRQLTLYDFVEDRLLYTPED